MMEAIIQSIQLVAQIEDLSRFFGVDAAFLLLSVKEHALDSNLYRLMVKADDGDILKGGILAGYFLIDLIKANDLQVFINVLGTPPASR